MARKTQQCGSIDGRSFTWPARSSLHMRAGIPGVYRIFSSKSRNKHHFAHRKSIYN